MASAVPAYQVAPTPPLSRAGKMAANELFPSRPHFVPAPTYVPNRTDSYCVKTPTTSIPELAQLLKGKSIILYFPPKCTAGFATFAVKASRRVPRPPAKIIATISFPIIFPPQS